MTTYDFSQSFLCFRVDLDQQPAITLSRPAPFRINNARILLESTCEVTDRRIGNSQLYALASSCKTELVGVREGIWITPNADFCLVASTEHAQIFKSWDKNNKGVMRFPESLGPQPERQVDRVDKLWAKFELRPFSVQGEILNSAERVIAAVFAGRRLNLRLQYDEGDFNIVIQHPIKTINVNEKDQFFQTDTGPIALPDLSDARMKSAAFFVGVFDLAYVAFKDPDWAEFIINVPTPLSDQISVNHYSKTRRIEQMTNCIIEMP